MEFLANSLACRFVVASTARVSIKGRESWPGLKSHGSNVCTLYPTGGNLGHKPGFYATWIPPSLFMTALSLSLSLPENFALNCNSLSLSLASRQLPRFAKLFHRFSSFVRPTCILWIVQDTPWRRSSIYV